MTEYKCTGFWYLPDNEERQVAGTLYISIKGDLRLSLIGTLSSEEEGETKSHRIVLGSVDKSPEGHAVTLTGCYKTEQHVGSHFESQEDYRASRGYFGVHLKEETDFLFRKFLLKISGLTEWASRISGLHRERYQIPTIKNQGEKITIATYLVPTPLSTMIPGASITLNMGIASKSGLHEITFREEANFFIKLDEPLSSEKIDREYVYPLQNLMTFVSDTAQELESFSVWQSDDSDWNNNPVIRVVGPRVQPDADLERKTPRRDQMLFTLEDILEPISFATFIEKWLRLANFHSKSFAIYFGMHYGPPAYIDMKYTLLSQALVLYYERSEAGIEHRKEEEQHLKDILIVVEEKHTDWLIEHLGVKPHPTFRNVLRRVMNKCGEAIDPIISKRRDAFINQAANTLQYIERRAPEDQLAASQGPEFYWLMQKLLFLIKACYLNELGFSSNNIADLYNRNESFQHLKKLESYLELERDHSS